MKQISLSILLLLFQVLIFRNSCAQNYKYVNFPKSNAVWGEVLWDSNSPTVFNQFALFKGDTVINGITYHKLFHSNTSTITSENSKCIGGIREDSQKRIWVSNLKNSIINYSYSNKNGEIMLYDFSLQVGDTIWAKKDFPNMGHGENLVIKRIDSLQIYKSIRKVFSFEKYPWIKWIEGIGNVQGLIFPYGELTTGGGLNSKLICMHHNDSLMFLNDASSSCIPQFVIDNVELLPNPDIKVYPNPVANGIVNFENLEFELLELFDLNGNLVRKENVKGTNCYELNLSNLPTGNYYYRLTTNGLLPTLGKLIIQ